MPSKLHGRWADAAGNGVANAILTLRLVNDATAVGSRQIAAPPVIKITLDSNGAVPASAPSVYQSTELTPATKYTLTVNNALFTVWSCGPVSLTGSPTIDLNSLVPVLP